MDELDLIDSWVLPESWCYAKLEDVGCGENAIVDGPFGSNLKVSDYIDDSDNGVPVLTTKNLEGDYSKGSVRYISQNKYEELKRSKVQSGDILVAKIGSIGKTGIYPIGMKTAIIPANLLKFTVTPSVEFKYVFAYLNCLGFQQFIKLISTATAQPAFNVTKFRKLPIPLPPLNEQHRIVAKIEELFSELDKGIENLKTAQAQLKVYRQALLKHAFEGKLTAQWREQNRDKLETAAALQQRIQQERAQRYQQQLADWEAGGKQGSKPKAPKHLPPLTAEELAELPELPEGWGWVKFGAITENFDGQRIPISAKERETKKGEYPYYGACSIIDYVDGYLFEGDYLLIGEDGANLLSKSKPLAFVVSGKFWVNNHAHIVQPLDCCHLKYLEHQFCSRNLNQYITGTAQPKLTQANLDKVPVALCALSEQQQIVQELEAKLSEADQLELTLTTSLQQAEALRQSILKRAFSGQLVPQDPHDELASVLLERIRAEQVQVATPKRKGKNS